MKRKTSRITSTDRRIFGSLYRAGRPLPLKKIATRTGMSWPTARASVIRLRNLGVVNTKKTIRRTNVYLEPKVLDALRKLRARRR